jgi:hypothetical protein
MKRGRRRRALAYAGSAFVVVVAVGALAVAIQSVTGGDPDVLAGDSATTTVPAVDEQRFQERSTEADGALDYVATTAAPSPTTAAAVAPDEATSTTVADTTTTTLAAPYSVVRRDEYESEDFPAADFYLNGRARRVVLTNPLAVVDLEERAFLEVSDAPFARATYGIVLPDGSLLAQELDALFGATLWRRSTDGRWSELPPVSDLPTLLAGYYGSDEGTVDLYFIESPFEEDPVFEDAGTIAIEYDYDNGTFSELWRRADLSGTRYSPNSTGEVILVEDQGVDPVYGPAYALLDAGTGAAPFGAEAHQPTAVFEDSGNPSIPDRRALRTPDHAAFITETEYVYIETNWEEGLLRSWVVGSTETSDVSNAAEVFELAASYPVDGYELFACRFGRYSVSGNAFVDLETGFVAEFYEDGYDPGPPFAAC